MGPAADSLCGTDQTEQRSLMFLESIQKDRHRHDHMHPSHSNMYSYQTVFVFQLDSAINCYKSFNCIKINI